MLIGGGEWQAIVLKGGAGSQPTAGQGKEDRNQLRFGEEEDRKQLRFGKEEDRKQLRCGEEDHKQGEGGEKRITGKEREGGGSQAG